MSSNIAFGGALFFCFFYFGRTKEKKEDGITILSSFTREIILVHWYIVNPEGDFPSERTKSSSLKEAMSFFIFVKTVPL